MKKWKKWLRKWAIIDIAVLGIGLILAVIYLFYGTTLLGQNSPVLNLWLNIATDLIGVWITVRIIDNLIHSREMKENIRRGLVNYLSSLSNVGHMLSPMISQPQVESMKIRQEAFENLSHERKKYFSAEEQYVIDQFCISWKNYIEHIETFVTLHQRIEDLIIDLSRSGEDINSDRAHVRYAFTHFQDAEFSLANRSALLAQYEGAFSATEFNNLKLLSQQLASQENEPSTQAETIRNIYSLTRPSNPKAMRWNWYFKAHNEFKRILGRHLYNAKAGEETIIVVENAIAEFEAKQMYVHKKLIPLFRSYLQTIKEMGKMRENVESTGIELEREIEKSKSKILLDK